MDGKIFVSDRIGYSYSDLYIYIHCLGQNTQCDCIREKSNMSSVPDGRERRYMYRRELADSSTVNADICHVLEAAAVASAAARCRLT